MPPSHLTARAFAKINLVLQVLGRRPDDYHELRTVFQTITLHDTLHLARAARRVLRFHCDPPVLGASPDNLILRAAALLRDTFRPSYGAEISLVKRIPIGAGLGGGSSNAAVTLLALNRLWGLNQPPEALQSLARALGADAPFFLWGGTALGIGRGDEVYPCKPIAPFHAVLIYPNVSVSTREAYADLNRGPLTASDGLAAARASAFCYKLLDGRKPFAGLFNDFEPVILTRYPEIARAHRFLQRHNASATLLCGSGSSVFGLYRDRREAAVACAAARDKGWIAFSVQSLSQRRYQRLLWSSRGVIQPR